MWTRSTHRTISAHACALDPRPHSGNRCPVSKLSSATAPCLRPPLHFPIITHHTNVYIKFPRMYECMSPERVLSGAVFVNFLRVPPTPAPSRFSYEGAVVWKGPRYAGVVPSLGVATTPLQLVSEWVLNGTVIEYVTADPGVNRISLAHTRDQSPPSRAVSRLNPFKCDRGTRLSPSHTSRGRQGCKCYEFRSDR